jgi:thioredoxin 1
MTTSSKLQIPFLFIAIVLFQIECAQKPADTSTKKTATIQTQTGPADKSSPVTFVELGSVNCIPCRMMQPVMKQIDSIYAGKVNVVFYDVMTADGRPKAQQYGIRAIPTQVFLNAEGKEFFRHIGFYPKDSIVALLKTNGVN